jgi:hypothetical protein
MTNIALESLALKFGLTVHIVKSWWEHLNFSSTQEAEDFFEQNLGIIKAKPFIKWVG